VDTYLAIASRRDERRYGSTPLPPEVVNRILDAGRLSGSSKNRQPWVFVVPEGRDRVERLAEAVFVPDNVRSAGLVIAIVVSGKGPTSFDAGRAAQNMLLAAWNEGVSACPNGIADIEAAAVALGATGDERPVIVLSFGIPERARKPESRPAADWSARANRKPMEDVVRRIS
jgi:nitroreductase